VSLKSMTRIIEEIDVTRPRQLVPLAIAEKVHDGDREGCPAQQMETR